MLGGNWFDFLFLAELQITSVYHWWGGYLNLEVPVKTSKSVFLTYETHPHSSQTSALHCVFVPLYLDLGTLVLFLSTFSLSSFIKLFIKSSYSICIIPICLSPSPTFLLLLLCSDMGTIFDFLKCFTISHKQIQ